LLHQTDHVQDDEAVGDQAVLDFVKITKSQPYRIACRWDMQPVFFESANIVPGGAHPVAAPPRTGHEHIVLALKVGKRCKQWLVEITGERLDAIYLVYRMRSLPAHLRSQVLSKTFSEIVSGDPVEEVPHQLLISYFDRYCVH